MQMKVFSKIWSFAIFFGLKKKKINKKDWSDCYTEKEALAAINSNWIESIQVPYNLINQEMNVKVFNLAKKNKIKIFTRSTFLKGVLTEKLSFCQKKWELLKRMLKKICLS